MAAWRDQIPGSSSLLELPRMLHDPIGFLEERYTRHGAVFQTRWIVPVIFLIGPDANKQIHVTERARFSYRLAYGELPIGKMFEHSLITEDGEEHRRDRELLQPAMGRLAIAGVLDQIAAIWERTADRIGARGELDAYDFARDSTFEVSANVLLTLGLERELEEYKPLFQTLLDGANASFSWRIPMTPFDRGLRARRRLIELLVPRIRAARDRDTPGMLGLLARYRLPDGKPISEERIAEHLLLLFWAGYDTTATSASWLLYELARAQDWQQRLFDEQRRVLSDRRLGMEDVAALQGHDAVLKEVERLRPVVLFFPRRTLEAIEVGGRQIASGTMVFYSPYLTHRIASLFPEPEKFDPARWETASSSLLVGFGGGPRICLGKAFALLQLNVMLTTIIRRFRFALADRARPKTLALPMHRPEGARIVFERR